MNSGQEIFLVHHGDTFVAEGSYRRLLKHGEWKGSYEERTYILYFNDGAATHATVTFGDATYSGPVFLAPCNVLYFRGHWKNKDGVVTLKWDDKNEARYHVDTDLETVDAVMVADGSYVEMRRWIRETNTTHFSRQPVSYGGGKWHAPGNPKGWYKGPDGRQVHGEWQQLEETDEWILIGDDGHVYNGSAD